MLGKNTPGLCLDGIILMLNNGGWDGNSGVWGYNGGWDGNSRVRG